MLRQSLWAIAAAACFSAMAACVKFCNGTFGSLELVFYRSAFTTVFILCLCVAKGCSLKTQYPFLHLKRDFYGFASVAIWFFTLGKLPLGTNITLTYCTPLFLAANFIILSRIQKRSAPWGSIGAIALGFLGIVLLVRPNFSESEFIACLLCLSVALIDLFGYWQLRFLGRVKEPSQRVVFYFAFTSMIGAALGVLLFTDGFHKPTLDNWIPLALMGLFATGGMLAATRAWMGGNMLLAACLGFSAIPFSELIGIVLFGNIPSLLSILGMICVCIAGMFATVFTKREEKLLNEAAEKSASAQSEKKFQPNN